MLIKLFKYDICAGARKYMLMIFIILSLALTSVLSSLLNLTVISTLVFAMSVILSIGCLAIYAAISVAHVYSQLCGRESYLTYTIPAGTKTIVISKILALLAWGTLTLILVGSYWVLYYHMCSDEAIKPIMESVVNELKTVPDIIYFLVATILPSVIFAIFQLVLCAAIANIPAMKNRNFGIPAAVLSWIVINQTINILLVGIWVIVILLNGGELSNSYLNDTANSELVLESLGMIMKVGYPIFTIISFFISTWLIEKHRSI